MDRIAFVFSGQGAQHTGMGRELYESSPAARDMFCRFEALRPGTLAQCFAGSEEELSLTINTQPCLFAVELAGAAALIEAGIRPDMTAGYSLGELSALALAGAAGEETMFRLVVKRAALMQEDAKAHPAVMAAVLKLSPGQVRGLCAEYPHVYPVNYNCPGQISVSGEAGEMAAFRERVMSAGGRYLPLKVSGGFHSPFLKTASEAFAGVLADTPLQVPSLPVYANRTGRPYASEGTEGLKETLAAQICSPVLWEDSIRAMRSDGAGIFIEIGPGAPLCGMIRRIDPSVPAFCVSTPEELEAVRAYLENCAC